ncbi:rhomboid family intramembrane serine protease [Idiomarina seosinensis]|uniref:rhomboid family intramembrane serine protease n=1 Tax=Idiomarina seosinensis TaxID=281739 RepID=UPI001300793D|nr:rhomboid family intramembrane serine protease [Idiomarina seosinensis]
MKQTTQQCLITLTPVAIVLVLLLLLPQQWLSLLAYQRGDGDWWEFLTAGFIHFELSHGVSSIIGLGVMWLLFAEHIKPLPVWLMLVATAVMSVAFEHWLAVEPYVMPTVTENKGFSGALYGFFACGATLDIIKRRPFGLVLWLLVIGKVTAEAVLGQPILSFSEVDRVAVMGHLGGAITGVFCALVYGFNLRHKQARQ